MPTVLVTGANRGLGLEFCRQYLSAGWHVLACCRAPEAARGLRALKTEPGMLELRRLDVGDFASIDILATQLKGVALDLLINNAGVYGDRSETGFGHVDYSRWLEVLRINTLAPVKMTEALLGNLRASEHPLTVAITSLMGSMADNSSGGALLYRSSKAGLNAAMKSLSLDLRPLDIGVLILHPGWVRTDMGGSNAPLTAADSVSGMRRVIARYSHSVSGRFLNFRGEDQPW